MPAILKRIAWMSLPALFSLQAATTPRTSIETASFDYANYRNHETIGGSIHTRIPIYKAQEQISLVAAAAGGSLKQDRGASYDRISAELGLQYQLFPVTTLTMAGSYEWMLGDYDYQTGAIHVRLKQSFQTEESPIVPFIRLNGAIQFIDPVVQSPAQQDDDYSLLVAEALAGIEIRMRKEFRWILEGGRSQSAAIGNDGPDLADGWIGSIAMQYDWF